MTPSTTDIAPRLVAPVALPRGRGRAVLLVLTCLLRPASTIQALRVEVRGLFVPLHLVPVVLALPAVVLPSLGRFPRDIRPPLLVFLTLFTISVARFGSMFGDIFKMAASVLTI